METLDTDGTSGIPSLPKHTGRGGGTSGTLKIPGENNSLNSTRGTTAMYPLVQSPLHHLINPEFVWLHVVP